MEVSWTITRIGPVYPSRKAQNHAGQSPWSLRRIENYRAPLCEGLAVYPIGFALLKSSAPPRLESLDLNPANIFLVSVTIFPQILNSIQLDHVLRAGMFATTRDRRRIVSAVVLSLARIGATFPISDIVELARWGHFERGDVPWETGQRI